MTVKLPLPVDAVLSQIADALRQHPGVVLVAPPGSGKTTRVAPSLLECDWMTPRDQIWLLQPRRIAARATAERIAAELGEVVGETVGYQVRFERRSSPRTRLMVATEGVLLRRLEQDPLLEGVRVVLLDEFHERSLNSDLLLAMLRQVQRAGREDLKLVVMSATMEAGPVSRYLGAVPTVEAAGMSHAVTIRHLTRRMPAPIADWVAEVILEQAPSSPGDLLVFLPGMGEIQAVKARLESAGSLRDWPIRMLHGSLPLEQQHEVLQRQTVRRIILATNVAETSLTVDGIRMVVDSGLARVLRFDPAVGLDRLELEPICQASAAQRAGRAGRTADGVCFRLWDAVGHRARPEWLDPEIRRTDVVSAVLQLLAWGEDPEQFPWFEAPRPEALAAARKLLGRLQAIDDAGRLTATGKTMSQLPVTPRLARLMVAGHGLGHPEALAVVAAMLSERDPFLRPRGSGSPATANRAGRGGEAVRWDCDVTERVLALYAWWNHNQAHHRFGEIHRGAAANLAQVARQLMESCLEALGPPGEPRCPLEEAIPRALLAAMPDRLARRREHGGGKALMVGGRGVKPGPLSGVQEAGLLLCVDVAAGNVDAIVHQATAIRREWLDPELVSTRNDLFFAPSSRSVQQRRREYWDDLVLAETPVAIDDEERCADVLFEAARTTLKDVQPDGGSVIRSLAARVGLLRSAAPELQLPELDEALQLDVLRELCRGRRSFDQLQEAPWMDWLASRFTTEQWSAIERETPVTIRVPSGSQRRILYEPGKPPVLAVKIQEIFSWLVTPRIAFGRTPLLLHLLAPNERPQQITDDLASFWKNTWPVVRGELRRRYPKHAWPEDPLTALPERKGSPRR